MGKESFPLHQMEQNGKEMKIEEKKQALELDKKIINFSIDVAGQIESGHRMAREIFQNLLRQGIDSLPLNSEILFAEIKDLPSLNQEEYSRMVRGAVETFRFDMEKLGKEHGLKIAAYDYEDSKRFKEYDLRIRTFQEIEGPAKFVASGNETTKLQFFLTKLKPDEEIYYSEMTITEKKPRKKLTDFLPASLKPKFK